MFNTTQAIEHHQRILKELDESSKRALIESLPAMREIAFYCLQSDNTHIYDLTKIKGEILFKVQCKDGLVVLVKLPGD